MENSLELFKSNDGAVALPVPVEGETVWLSQAQMAALFCKDQSVIARHIKNAISEGEIDISTMYAKFAYSGENVSGVQKVGVYNLDDLYPSAQEKAANLLYLVTKNHGFSDGNKRIAAGLFLYFLSRNRMIFRKDGSK